MLKKGNCRQSRLQVITRRFPSTHARVINFSLFVFIEDYFLSVPILLDPNLHSDFLSVFIHDVMRNQYSLSMTFMLRFKA